MSFRDVEELLTERGAVVSYESIRQWCQKFGPRYARNLRRKQGRLGDIWHLAELFVNIQGKRHYLWRAADQDGDVIDILVKRDRNARAAKRFFRKLLKGRGTAPWRLVIDKLRSYSAARREVMPSVTHETQQYANKRADVSHQPTRQRERRMRRFRSVGQAQRFLKLAMPPGILTNKQLFVYPTSKPLEWLTFCGAYRSSVTKPEPARVRVAVEAPPGAGTRRAAIESSVGQARR